MNILGLSPLTRVVKPLQHSSVAGVPLLQMLEYLVYFISSSSINESAKAKITSPRLVVSKAQQTKNSFYKLFLPW